MMKLNVWPLVILTGFGVGLLFYALMRRPRTMPTPLALTLERRQMLCKLPEDC